MKKRLKSRPILKSEYKWHSILLSVFIFVVLASSCTVRMVAPYDEITDRQSYELQEKILVQFTEWKRDIGPLEDYHRFYDEVDTRLSILIERNKQIPDSEFIVGMLERIHENMITEIRELHDQNLLDEEVITQIQPDIMAQFSAIQKFQMALKRSENTSSN